MQSGISASQELHTAFQTLVSDPQTHRGLIATITNEELTPSTHLPTKSSNFLSDLSSLPPHLKDNEAAYIILRRYDDSPSDGYIAITYVPDSAPVRQKMLFAATRLTLVRELGIERFRETIFATTKEELTADGFKKHDAHKGVEAPLTEEEESLGAVKKAEAEEGRGTAFKRSHLSDHFSMKVSDAAIGALRDLAESMSSEGQENGNNLVQLKIEMPSELIDLASTTSATPSTISSQISTTEPRFSLYRYSPPASTASKILFIYTCPPGSKIKERMLYASTSRALVSVIESEGGLKVDKKIETSEPSEVTKERIEDEFEDKSAEVKKAFDRPKRPGRR